MGTDIHIMVETYLQDIWDVVEPPYKTNYSDGEDWYMFAPWRQWEMDEDDPLANLPDPTDRNYNVFAFLADVRNGYGFAGTPSHKPVVPQFPNRGIPNNTGYNNLDVDGNFNWLGDHSFTWATLKELLEASWAIEYESVGVIDQDQYAIYKENGIPDDWSGRISGPGIRTLSESQYLEAVGEGTLQEKDYILVSWSWNPLVESGFYRWIQGDWMRELLDTVGNDPDKIRVTMGFDS